MSREISVWLKKYADNENPIIATTIIVAGNIFSISINLSGEFLVVFDVVSKIVGVNEVFSSVVGRVNVDHFDFLKITFLKQFQSKVWHSVEKASDLLH